VLPTTSSSSWAALTHRPSPLLGECQLTFIDRQNIDLGRASAQHAAYCASLQAAGIQVQVLETSLDLPDSAFVEDCAVILDELAVLTRPGSPVRQPEVERLAPLIAQLRPVVRMQPPATLDGGDVLKIGKKLYVGISTRTNPAGIAALVEAVQSHGYQVIPVPVHGSLHLKTACTALDDEILLANLDWIDLTRFGGLRILPVPEEESWGANVLRIGGRIWAQTAFPRTLEMLQKEGYIVQEIDCSEFLKAEAGLTCLSLVYQV
jgi:dimethylargininase